MRILDKENRDFLQSYADGINHFTLFHEHEFPLELSLAGIRPEKWEIEDSLAIMYYMGWNSAANLDTEIIAAMLHEKLGMEKSAELLPIHFNPDDPEALIFQVSGMDENLPNLAVSDDATLMGFLHAPKGSSSNNWSVSGKRSKRGRPILANDPHLDSRVLPGPLHPVGAITPDARFVGVSVPGVPGLVMGRTEHIAMGATNAYGDAQDLYIETLDPADNDRYLEGDVSKPFEIIEQTLRIKDGDSVREELLRVKLTRRGPVISGVLKGLETDRVMTVRWSAFESMAPSFGLPELTRARNVREAAAAWRKMNMVVLNLAFVDTQGGFSRGLSGQLPIRRKGNGTIPLEVVDESDDWTGWISDDDLPSDTNPVRGWVGGCNHLLTTGDHPYYSSHVSPYHRYARLKEILTPEKALSAEDHWRIQQDTVNLMARVVVPTMVRALDANEETKKLASILGQWDFRDTADSAAPAVFHSVYNRFARLTYEDELGPELTALMLENEYYWQERLERKVLSGDYEWFDDVRTPELRETRDMLLRKAGMQILEEFSGEHGPDPADWRWGDLHRMQYLHPLRRQGFGSGLFGSGPYPMDGSSETLYRSTYKLSSLYDVKVTAALRIVVDMGDPDKFLAVLPAGVTDRLFDPHARDQIEAYQSGTLQYWWFSDQEIEKHRRYELLLVPR